MEAQVDIAQESNLGDSRAAEDSVHHVPACVEEDVSKAGGISMSPNADKMLSSSSSVGRTHHCFDWKGLVERKGLESKSLMMQYVETGREYFQCYLVSEKLDPAST